MPTPETRFGRPLRTHPDAERSRVAIHASDDDANPSFSRICFGKLWVLLLAAGALIFAFTAFGHEGAPMHGTHSGPPPQGPRRANVLQ